LKTVLRYSQSELQSMASLGNLGVSFAVFAGMGFDAFGPKVAGAVAAVYLATGFALTALGASGRLTADGAPISWGWMALFSAIWQHGGMWADVCAIATSTRNFPLSRGQIIGLLKAGDGLTASMLALLYEGFSMDAVSFLWLLTALIPSTTLAAAVFQTVVSAEEAAPALDSRRLRSSYALLTLLGLYILTTALLIAFGAVRAGAGWCVPMLLLMTAAAGVIAAPCLPAPKRPKSASADPSDASDAYAALLEGSGDEGEDGIDGRRGRRGREAAEVVEGSGDEEGSRTVCEALRDVEFYLVFLAMMAGVGSSVMVINNIAQIVLAASPDAQPSAYVATFSIGNCLGRMLFGALSDALAARLNRPGWLAVVVGLIGSALLLMLVNDASSLLVTSLYLGTVYGGFWAVGPSTLADLYGPRHFATIYSITMLAPAIGGYALSAVLAARVYEAYADPLTRTCLGPRCFRLTFLVAAASCLLGALAAAWASLRLARRTRPPLPHRISQQIDLAHSVR
jgi:Nodulin-like